MATKMTVQTELQRDAATGLLSRDIADKVIGYLASIGWLDRGMAQTIYGDIASKIQHEIEKREI